MNFIYSTFILSPAEYAKIYSDILSGTMDAYASKNMKACRLQSMHLMVLIIKHIGIILKIMDMITIIFICGLKCKEDNHMNELSALLNGIEDSYFDFVSAMLHYAEKKPSRLEALLKYIKANPNVKSSDVVKFVSDQPDFFEDSAYMKVG